MKHEHHVWKKHYYDSEINAWVWGPCRLCKAVRITTTTCNDVFVWCGRRPEGYVTEFYALVLTDDFVNGVSPWKPKEVEEELVKKIRRVL